MVSLLSEFGPTQKLLEDKFKLELELVDKKSLLPYYLSQILSIDNLNP